MRVDELVMFLRHLMQLQARSRAAQTLGCNSPLNSTESRAFTKTRPSSPQSTSTCLHFWAVQ